LNREYGQYSNSFNNALSGKKAIIYQTGCGWDDATGHVDIWNGKEALDYKYPECDNTYIWELK
jgi:hypothetical protein